MKPPWIPQIGIEHRLKMRSDIWLDVKRRALGTIGEILGLLKQNGDEVKKCYIKYFDVFTSYYKTARGRNQEYRSNLDMPTKIVEEGKGYTCLASHQCDFAEIKAPNMETANRKGKEKIHHFSVKLKDLNEKEYHDSRQLYHIQLNRKKGSTLNKGIKIKTEDTSNTSNSIAWSPEFVPFMGPKDGSGTAGSSKKLECSDKLQDSLVKHEDSVKNDSSDPSEKHKS
nr:ARID DNA-binding domain-containing protein [Tanacetum cinerariifolium]